MAKVKVGGGRIFIFGFSDLHTPPPQDVFGTFPNLFQLLGIIFHILDVHIGHKWRHILSFRNLMELVGVMFVVITKFRLIILAKCIFKALLKTGDLITMNRIG